MLCPKDGNPLQPVREGGLDVVACESCKGRWLDYSVFYRSVRSLGTDAARMILVDRAATCFSCPRCATSLVQGKYAQRPSLALEMCERCRGVWLDEGELGHFLEVQKASVQEPKLVGGRFHVGDSMLAGRFSTLYHAVDVASNTPVVLRKYRQSTATSKGQDEQVRLQLMREGRMLSQMGHRNLPRVLETVEDRDYIYLVMEDFEGWPLDELVEGMGQPASEELLRRLLEQFLSVVGYFHRQNPPIIHRDLRPDSVLITPHGVIKLAEFGLATMDTTAKKGARTSFRSFGSAEYAAPEQLSGSPSRPQNDLYAVGAILCYLATGSAPPRSMDLYQGTAQTPQLGVLRPDLSSAITSLILMLMHPEADLRPPTADAVRDLLQQLDADQEARMAAEESAKLQEALSLDDVPLERVPGAEREAALPTAELPELPAAVAVAAAEPDVAVATLAVAEPGPEPEPPRAAEPVVPIEPGAAEPVAPVGPEPPGAAEPVAAVAPRPRRAARAAPPAEPELPPAPEPGAAVEPQPPESAEPGPGVELQPPEYAEPGAAVEPSLAPRPMPAPPPAAPARPDGKKSLWGFLFGQKSRRDLPMATDGPDTEELDKYPLIDLATMQIDRETARVLPETVCRSIQGICVGRQSTTVLTVAVKDPTQVHIYDHVSYGTQGKYQAVLVRADPLLLDLAVEFVYRIPTFASKLAWNEWLERKKLEAETLDVKTSADVTFGADDITSPIIAAVERIIKEAISSGASDIHLETFEREMLVRYRIDGVLHEISSFETREAGAIVKRVKILANMDIAQDRVTQGGRISVAVAGQELDLRVSIVPVPAGESVVLRLLKKGAFNLTLQDLGFRENDENRFRRILSQPYGMVLVSGPTGSGKSTTLYASLREIQRPDRKLLTIEDPIEYQMPRITQVQVNNTPREEEKRVTFARALREFLRQDPDVILVGEIRDEETAAIAIQAALTGHMLLSTIHTNDSVGIVARLRDMGVEPYLIGSTMLGGVAQRLCRRICKECKEEVPMPPRYVDVFAAEGLESPKLCRGKGCQSCHGTGYRGRMGLYEILDLTPDVRELVSSRARDEEIRRAATSHGFRTLYQDGLVKAALGQVTMDEVERVCMTL